jgi:toxin ParE1/3/4
MTQLRWTEPALGDLERICAWVEAHGEQSAIRLVSRLRDRAESLAGLPNQGPPGRIEGTCELVVAGTDYLILYRLKEDTVELLRVVHTRQKWPPNL